MKDLFRVPFMAADIAEGAGEMVNEVVDTAVEETKHVTGIFTDLWAFVQSKIPTVLYAIVIFAIGMILAKAAIKIVLKFMTKANVDKTIFGFIRSLVSIILYVLVAIITLTVLNVPMTSIIAVISAAGLAIGLAVQDSLSNLAGGFIILLSKPFKVGDFIETGDTSGVVENISILYTRIVTGDNKTIHIPNGAVAGARIVNYDEKSTRRLDLKFSVSYDCDYKKAKKIILDTIEKHPLTLKDNAPMVRMGEHGDSAIIIYARAWVSAANYWDLNFDLLEQIKDEFDSQGIEIPYNHLDVHITNNEK